MSKSKCENTKKNNNIEAACELSPDTGSSCSNTGDGCKAGKGKAKKQ